jgi:hypothetical protein
MLFGAFDYLRYRKRTGRFSRDPEYSVMAGAFEGSLSPQAIKVMQPGDVIFVQTLDRFVSWLIMYLTSSEVSHVAVYIGNEMIAHAVPGGTRFESISALYGSNSRLLPGLWPTSKEQRKDASEALRSFEGRPYGYLAVLVKAVRILTGRDWPYFRWKFAGDIAILLAAADLPFIMLSSGSPHLLWLLLPYSALILFNAVLWCLWPLRLTEWTGKPIDLMRALQASGGALAADLYSLQRNYKAKLDDVDA